MRRLRQVVFVALVLAMAVNGKVAVAQQFIDPTIELQLPTIAFDTNINPVPGTFSNDALNIIRAHRVALQQTQAVLQYLKIHRAEILAGQNAWYNEVFGDFYNPNSPFAGLYDRTLQVATFDRFGVPIVDRFGNAVTEEQYNTAHFDRVVSVYLRIQQALNSATTYAWGAQPADPVNQGVFDTYRTAVLPVGDPLFGNAAITITQETGELKWGSSTSFTPRHLAQIANTPGVPLRWDIDNDIGGTLTPAQELAFFRDRLDAYSVTTTASLTGTTEVYVGGAFLNEEMRSNSTVPGEPNPFFHPTELNQYQQLIEALAESEGSLGYDLVTTDVVTTTDQNGVTVITFSSTTGPSTGTTVAGTTTTTTTTTVNGSTQTVTTDTTISFVSAVTPIESGLVNLFGDNAYFLAALDSKSYAKFADVFKPVAEGGVGDGNLLPPPGKQGTVSSVFSPVVPGS